MYQVKLEQEKERYKSELQLKKEKLKQIRDFHQPMDFKSLDEHKERFDMERKRLTINYEETRNRKNIEIKKENNEIIKTLRGLQPNGQDKVNINSVEEDLEALKENLKNKFKVSPSK